MVYNQGASASQGQCCPIPIESILELSAGIGIEEKVIKQVYATLNSPKYFGLEEWKSVPDRVLDVGVLEGIYKEIVHAIQESENIENLDKSLNMIIDRWAEVKSLKKCVDLMDTCIADLFIELKKGKINEVAFERELTLNHVRVPHYETTILAFILIATMVHYNKIASKLEQKQIYSTIINRLNRLKIEKKMRAKFFDYIRRVIKDKLNPEIKLKNVIITYEELLSALRTGI